MWLLNKAIPSISTQRLSKSISKHKQCGSQKEEMEKEWLLLGEASSPVNQPNASAVNAESAILSDTTASDTECIVKDDNSESESEEDIDSIVEEFQQKVKVSTAGLKDSNLKIPSMGSWRIAMMCIFSVIGSSVGASMCAYYELTIPFAMSIGGKLNNLAPGVVAKLMNLNFSVVFVMSVVMLWIPRYVYSHKTPSVFTCTFSLLFNAILLSTMMIDSWIAIVFWLVSGVALVLQSLIKCDVWCCLCLDYPHHPRHTTILMEENLIPNGSSRIPTTATIRIKSPPISQSVINHVQTPRR
jgi:hypothetical protein